MQTQSPRFPAHRDAMIEDTLLPQQPSASSLPAPTQDEADFLKTHGTGVFHKPVLPVEHEVAWPTQADADMARLGDLPEPEVVVAAPRSLEVGPPTPTQADADIARRFNLPEPQGAIPAAEPGALVDPTQPEADLFKMMAHGAMDPTQPLGGTAWDDGTVWDDGATVWDKP